jgi:hypothetical protein
MTSNKEKYMIKPEVVITKFGYDYILVECLNREGKYFPCAMGKPGYVIKAVRKSKKKDK